MTPLTIEPGHKLMKRQHWRGVLGTFGLGGPPNGDLRVTMRAQQKVLVVRPGLFDCYSFRQHSEMDAGG